MTQLIQSSLIKIQRKINEELLNNYELHDEKYVKREYIELILSNLGWNKFYKFRNPFKVITEKEIMFSKNFK